jgi:hypothetical protein
VGVFGYWGVARTCGGASEWKGRWLERGWNDGRWLLAHQACDYEEWFLDWF